MALGHCAWLLGGQQRKNRKLSSLLLQLQVGRVFRGEGLELVFNARKHMSAYILYAPIRFSKLLKRCLVSFAPTVIYHKIGQFVKKCPTKCPIPLTPRGRHWNWSSFVLEEFYSAVLLLSIFGGASDWWSMEEDKAALVWVQQKGSTRKDSF